jgi:hypothetical protein
LAFFDHSTRHVGIIELQFERRMEKGFEFRHQAFRRNTWPDEPGRNPNGEGLGASMSILPHTSEPESLAEVRTRANWR